MNVATTKERIMELLEIKGETPADFYRKTGIRRGFLDADKLKATVNDVFIASIIASYPNLNIEWLITGKGKMFSCTNDKVETIKDSQADSLQTRPRIPLHAAAGSLTIAESGVMFEECEQFPIIESLPKYDFTIRVRGNSMVPEFHSGDEVACLFIREQPFIQWGRIHVLDTAQGIIMKMLDDGGDCYICRSANASYKEFKIPKLEVYNIALVVGLVRTY